MEAGFNFTFFFLRYSLIIVIIIHNVS